MANPEHLEILMQGVEVWNEWKRKSVLIVPELSSATLRGINLSGIDLRLARLEHADMRDTNLTDANLTLTNLSHANLSGANLTRATLFSAIAYNANFSDTKLLGTDFRLTELLAAKMNSAEMGYAIFGDNDLSAVEGLDSVKHGGPSDIGIHTIYRSGGRIPKVFMCGAGIPDSVIEHMALLTRQTFESYKCFISFTEADDNFSEKIYNDLQTSGVRCWRWKEDAKWGQVLMQSIDDAINLYDKLIVICSEQSLNSPAVIREIERALQKEDELARQGKRSEVLFPIRLDDFVFIGWKHYRKADVIAKTVGDFRQWTDEELYLKAFAHLIRDLRAG
jgi:hypothetical protein